MQVTVTMGDVDSYQIHFGSYYRWMDLAYHKLLHRAGIKVKDMLAGAAATPAVHSECDYLAPVHVDEELTVYAWLGQSGRSSYAVKCLFLNEGGRVVAQGKVIHVYVEHGRPKTMPAWLRNLAVEESQQ
ncbi:MAG: acyl-CoA thioesterase [Ktedonobacteraceae bacterium]|nr:acyl-CoA thioesterase [Ktedonobacteraceae bacterium]